MLGLKKKRKKNMVDMLPRPLKTENVKKAFIVVFIFYYLFGK
jgi:hypothetical protein